MKRIALILSLLVVSGGVIIAGNLHWKQSIKKTTEKAKVTLHVPSNSTNVNNQTNVPADSSTTGTASGSPTTQQGSNLNSNTSNSQSNIVQAGQKGSTTNSQNEVNQTATAGSTPTNGSGTTSSASDNASTPQKKTVEEIKSQYRSLFSELEAAETSKIDHLVIAAKAEYVSKKTAKSELAVKYQSIAKQMEQSADNSFNVIYQNLQYDLDKNGYSLNEAQEFHVAYNAKKQEHLNRIISQVRGF
ncbi:MAG: hypothetical protein Q8906_14350 [Bacillota bacterium]|nr:hypothetical protein [Bacillota bacterium]